MAHIEKTILIDAPVETVFQYATTIPKLTEWWASLVEVRKFPQERMAPGVKYEWTYKMVGVKLDGVTEIAALEPNAHVLFKNTGGIPSTLDYRYASEGGKTRVSVVMDYTLPGSVLGKLADKLVVERLNEREAENVLANLKSICEAIAKSASAGARG